MKSRVRGQGSGVSDQLRLIVGLLCCLATGCQRQDERPVIGTTYVGYASRYDEQPVVQQHVSIEAGYDVTFFAYDRGDEAHLIVYAQQTRTGEYLTGLVRVAIQDPDGNALTIYRQTESEPVDEPIIWKPRTRGVHTVDVEFTRPGDLKSRVSFTVPLVRQPAPIALLASVGAGIVLAVGAVGYLLRKRQRRAATT